MRGGQVRDFSGGPNLRDSGPELAENESVGGWNVTSDERGGVSSRLGYVKYNAALLDAADSVQAGFKWRTAGKLIWQAGKDLYVNDSNVSVKTFTTAARCSFAEMAGKLIVAHPADGLFTSTDAVTFTAVADADAPTDGTCLEVWDNKLWVGGIGEAQLQWSNAGDPTAWTATDFNQLRSKDEQPLVALKVASGLDISGRAGLLAFKNDSSYRVYASDTGAYETVDAHVGAASAIAVVSYGPRCYTISQHGIYWWQEGVQGMQEAAGRYEPLWDPSQINFARLDLFCAGRKGTRVRFSVPTVGQTVNTLAFEHHPEQQWTYLGSNAAACYVTDDDDDEILYAGAPGAPGQVWILDSGGTDDGAAIGWWFQTRWFELNDGFQVQLWQVRVHGRGNGTMTVRTDYRSSGGDDYAFTLSDPSAATYDNGVLYDSGVTYQIPSAQYTEPFYGIGVCRQFSLRFSGSATTTSTLAALLDGGTGPTVGAFGLLGIEWLHIPLGLS